MESIVIFGASLTGRASYFLLKDRFNIRYFCDNNEELIGKRIENIEIISPTLLKKFETQYDRIVIASSSYEEIRKQLSRLEILKPVQRIKVNLEDSPLVLNFNSDYDEILRFVTGEQFSNGLGIKYDKVGREKSRIDIVKEIVSGCNVIHLGCTDHLSIIDYKLAHNKWLHSIISSVAKKCIGIDNNRQAVDYAVKLGYSNILYADILSNQIDEVIKGKWDYLLIAEVLEHINEPVKFLTSIKDQYKNIEKVIITVPNALSKSNFELAQRNIERINTDHKYWFTPYTTIKVLNEAGYKLERLIMCGPEKQKDLLNQPLMMSNIVVIAK